MSDPVTTLMWEAVAADVDAVVAWARGLAADGLLRRETYVADDARIVLVTHWGSAEQAAAADLTPPPGTLLRAAHVWRFTRVE